MDSQNFSSFLDIAKLETDVIEKAGLFLAEINEDNLKAFSDEVKKIAEGTLQEYVFKVCDEYIEKGSSENDEFISRFVDFQSGYQQTMLSWIEQNEIIVQQQSIEFPESPSLPDCNNRSNSVVVTGTVGTIIATGLLIFGHPWLALAVELLTVAVSYHAYKKNQKSQKQYQIELEAYELKLKAMKNELVNGITEDLIKWVEKGVEYSNSLIDSYKTSK